jgi:hypothetical protein
LALYDLRARSGTSEVMAVGLALMALAFSHPMGAAFAFAAVPFLVFAVRPVLVASSAMNVVIALIFPTLFMRSLPSLCVVGFSGRRLELLCRADAKPVAVDRGRGAALRQRPFRLSNIDASLAMGAALAIGAPIAVVMLALVYRRRPLVVPAGLRRHRDRGNRDQRRSGFFGDPTAIVVALRCWRRSS